MALITWLPHWRFVFVFALMPIENQIPRPSKIKHFPNFLIFSPLPKYVLCFVHGILSNRLLWLCLIYLIFSFRLSLIFRVKPFLITRAHCEYFFHRDIFIVGLTHLTYYKTYFTISFEFLGICPVSLDFNALKGKGHMFPEHGSVATA